MTYAVLQTAYCQLFFLLPATAPASCYCYYFQIPYFFASNIVEPVVNTITDTELTGISIAAISGDNVPDTAKLNPNDFNGWQDLKKYLEKEKSLEELKNPSMYQSFIHSIGKFYLLIGIDLLIGLLIKWNNKRTIYPRFCQILANTQSINIHG